MYPVCFQHAGAERERQVFSTALDARPEAGGAVEIPLDVSAVAGNAERSEGLRLSWPEVPVGLRAVLVDAATNTETDLSAASNYAFALTAGAPPRLVLRLTSESVTASEPASSGGVRLEAPRPNPSRSWSSVSFTLAEAGPVRVVVVDALGREAAVVAEGDLSAGEHTVSVPVVGLASGVYVVRLEAAGERVSRRLAVVR